MMGGVLPVHARRYLAEFIHSAAYDQPLYLAWGNGTNDITEYDTRLYNEIQRVQATITANTQYVQLTYDFTITAAIIALTTTAAECGLFDASAGGVMWYRGGFHQGAPAKAASGYYQGTPRTIALADILRVTLTFYLRQS
jgi:hypothetical protein